MPSAHNETSQQQPGAAPHAQPGCILVTGAGGMLGHDVVAELQRRALRFRALDRAACDVTDLAACQRILDDLPPADRPAVIINCAAYTDVNRAESEEELATRINGRGPENLAYACHHAGARLIHVSTDYVFDGTKTGPYEPADPTAPLNAYGRSKLAGEHAIDAQLSADQYVIARTSWLYGTNGPNFVKTMLRLASENRDLKVIHDQIGAPTYTADLARAVVDLAVKPAASGILHATGGGHCSWFEFAQEIFELTGIYPASLSPCGSDDFPTPARRPQNSRLSPDSLTAAGISPLPHWKDALRRYLAETGQLRRP